MVIRARKKHYKQIEALMEACGSAPIPESAINAHEISLVAMRGRNVVGFTWATLIAGGKIALVSNICVHPNYRKRGIAKRLSEKLSHVLDRKGAVQVWAYLDQNDPEFDIIGTHVAKCGMVGGPEDSMKVYATVSRIREVMEAKNA